jgi:tetratricopeptide (TPR) repeat protein
MKYILLSLQILLFFNCLARSGDNTKRAIELNDQAIQLSVHGKIDSALTLLDKAIQTDSNYKRAYGNKLTFLWQLNRNEEALRTAIRLSKLKNATGADYFWVGYALEHLGKLDKAKESYLIVLNSAETHKSVTLNILQKMTHAELLAIVKGKEFGMKEMQRIAEEYRDSSSIKVLSILRFTKNEIESYNGGGFLEFEQGETIHYCLTTDKSSKEVSDFLEENGINTKGVSMKAGEGIAHIEIRNKFRKKALELGLVECTL